MARRARPGFLPEEPFRPLLQRRQALDALQDQCRKYSWPCLITNEDFEIVGWNEAANDLSEIDFGVDLAEPGARHLLRMAATEHFGKKLLNWNTVIGVMVGMYRYDRMSPSKPEAGTASFNALFTYLQDHHPDVLMRVVALWQTAPPYVDGLYWFTTSVTVPPVGSWPGTGLG